MVKLNEDETIVEPAADAVVVVSVVEKNEDVDKAEVVETKTEPEPENNNKTENGNVTDDAAAPTPEMAVAENGAKIEHSQSDQENQRPEPKVGNKKTRHRKKGVPIPLEFLAIKDYQPYVERTGYIQESNGQPRKPRRRLDMENAEPTEKLFVGGLPLSIRDDGLKDYFSQYGQVVEAQVKAERGFGFVTFSSIEEADKALENKNHKIEEKEIEVKRAIANNKYMNQNGQQRSARLSDGSWSVPSNVPNGGGGAGPPFTPQNMPYYPQPVMYPHQMVYPMADVATIPAPTVISTPVNMVATPPSGESVSPSAATPPTDITNSAQQQCPSYDPNAYFDEADPNHHQQQKKLFIGGLHWKTNDDDLRNYFSAYGTVTDAMVIIEPNSQRSRGFGFVVFANPEIAEHVVSTQNHKINDKVVDVKRAISKDDEADELGKNVPVDKIFVGGLSHETTRESLMSFFSTNFGGKVVRVDMKMDDQTGQHRGYAFLTFDSTEVVDLICQNKFHKIGPHLCEVKKAHSKDVNLSEQNNNNRETRVYSNRQQSYYASYTQYPVDGIYYQPVSYVPFQYTVPVTISSAHHPTSQPSVPTSNANNNETQGEYIGGTWYPLNGKDSENNETDDHSEEMAPYVQGYYNAPSYNPATAYTCGPYVAPYTTYAPAHYAQQVKDH